MKKTAVSIPVLCCALALSACNNNDDPAPKTGVFIDALVKGLDYQTNSRLGKTNEKGEFEYLEGETVTFSLDGLVLGSTKAAAEVPVTALPQTQEVAQILQTLDTDDDENLIDVTGIKLTDSARDSLSVLLKLADEGTLIENVLTIDEIQAIQTKSGVDIVNTEAVSLTAAAQHVRDKHSTVDWAKEDLEGRLYFDANQDGGVFILLSAANTGYFVDAISAGVTPFPMTWGVSADNKKASLTIPCCNINFEAQILRRDGEDLELFVDDIGQGVSYIEEYKAAIPITEVNGKHFQEISSKFNVPSTSDPSCPGDYFRTYSLTTENIIANTVCYEADGAVKDFTSYTYKRDQEPAVKNVISGTRFDEEGVRYDVGLAIFDDNFDGGLVSQFLFTNGVLTGTRVSREFVEVEKPVANEPRS